MINNIEVEHKFKLGDVVWVRGTETIYETCSKCKGNPYKGKDIIKVVKATVVSINIQCFLTSSPNTTNIITYSLRRENGSNIFNCHEADLHKSKNKAQSSINSIYVAGL